MHDPDTSNGDVTHWLRWNIPAEEKSLAEGTGNQSAGSTGANQHDDVAHLPPMPRPGDPPHRYIFELYALNLPTLKLRRRSKRENFEKAISPYVVSAARFSGHFWPVSNLGDKFLIWPERPPKAAMNVVGSK